MSQQRQQPTGSIGQETYGGQLGQQQPTQQMGGQTGGQIGGTTGGQIGAQQSGMSHRQTHEKVGKQFEAEMTNELNQALESFDRVVEISEWCADKCIESGPQMAECARLCEDLADLASLNEKLIARDSINGPEVAEAFLRVAQQGMPILQQYQQTPHVRETLQAVDQALDATNKLLGSIGQQMGQQLQGQMTQQPQGQSFQQPQGQSFQQPQTQSFQQPQGQTFQQPQSQMGQQPTGQSFQQSY